MAILKTTNQIRNENVSYWKIVRTTPNFYNNTTEVALYGYTDKQQRLDYPDEPLDTRVIQIDRAIETRAEVYTDLMTVSLGVDDEGNAIGKYEFFNGQEV